VEGGLSAVGWVRHAQHPAAAGGWRGGGGREGEGGSLPAWRTLPPAQLLGSPAHLAAARADLAVSEAAVATPAQAAPCVHACMCVYMRVRLHMLDDCAPGSRLKQA
jgi:hypothetical protein